MPHSDPQRSKEYRQKWHRQQYDARRAAGICVKCGARPAEPGRAQCTPCAVEVRQGQIKRQSHGRCPNCSIPVEQSGLCGSCKETARARRLKRLERGCCSKCGVPAIRGTQCARCAAGSVLAQARYRAKRGNYLPILMSVDDFTAWYCSSLATADGHCAWCREPFGKRGPIVDHDHATGIPRALVCHPCNVVEGFGVRRIECVLAALSAHRSSECP